MAEAQTIGPYGKLLSDVLADLSAATPQAYEKDLKDFSQEYLKLPKGVPYPPARNPTQCHH